MLLKDKVAIVTGAGSGIGEGIALRFGQDGAKIVVAEVDEKKGKATAAKLKELKADALVVPTDVSRVQDIDAMVAKSFQHFGRVDILVNNAGIRFASLIIEMPDEEWLKTIGTNLTGVFFCLRRTAAEMVKRGIPGSIVNISSVAGMRGIRNRAAYCAAKAGVISLTQVAALELAPHNIRVNAIAPGLIETALTAHYLTGTDPDSKMMAEKFAATIPLGRWGQPSDIAAAATYLASQESSYVTGTTLVVDAGLTAA